MKKIFHLHAPFAPAGSQIDAIKQLEQQRPGISTLLGVTGSGKTYTIAHVIAQQENPVLVISPNKTLAAQLYEEFPSFPDNKVCYFVSYYDYYQPESYLPAQDIYIPKETKTNSEIERLRIEATASLINRPDTIVVASVSAIYSLGNPHDYRNLALPLKVGQAITRAHLVKELIFIHYARNEVDKKSGTFQVLGNSIEIILPYYKDKLRIELFGTTIDRIQFVNKLNNTVLLNLDNILIFPAKHFVTTEETKKRALDSIQGELNNYVPQLKNDIYRDRIQRRVMHDLEMIRELGYCSGIENYSSHFDGRPPGAPPYCLLDFFPDNFLFIIDESHIALPQLRGMYAGDRSRKTMLIEYGFRLPSAYDNRPLTFTEIEKFFKNAIFVSATPGDYEISHSQHVVEQIIRPTGLVDPVITVMPRHDQMTTLITAIKETRDAGYRSLVMVLTKRLAEELASYLENQEISVCYLHSDLKTPQRTELLQKLRLGIFDCMVGVNLLREGIDLPEVALVAIMDADVESFLRDKKSLIQIIGRAARNTHARVILFADKTTLSMHAAITETERRRTLQQEYNQHHNITPRTVQRDVVKSIVNIQEAIAQASRSKKEKKTQKAASLTPQERTLRIVALEQQMRDAAENLDFEKALTLRHEWQTLKNQEEKV